MTGHGPSFEAPPALRDDEEGPEAAIEQRGEIARGDNGFNDSDQELTNLPGRKPPRAFVDPNVPAYTLNDELKKNKKKSEASDAMRDDGAKKKNLVEMQTAIEKLKQMRVQLGDGDSMK